MKWNQLLFIISLLLCLPNLSTGQGITVCNSFDTPWTNIYADTTESWEVGAPSTTLFNSSYSGANSMVTDLDSNYSANDTSVFYATLKDQWGAPIPYYLGHYEPVVIQFTHRFITSSPNDYGNVEMSFDGGVGWYPVLTSAYNYGPPGSNSHYEVSTGNTTYDSITVSGFSNGWIHSSISKRFMSILQDDYNWQLFPDSILFKFSFISDSANNNEGWQIDDLCLSIDFIGSVNEHLPIEKLVLHPNPNNGSFTIKNTSDETALLKIHNLLGQEVVSTTVNVNEQQFSLRLDPGMYTATVYERRKIRTARMVVE
jgi:hypothetical protein